MNKLPEQVMQTFSETLTFLSQPYPPKKRLFERRLTSEQRLKEHNETIKKGKEALLIRMKRHAKRHKMKLCPKCGGRGTIPAPTNHGLPGQQDYYCFNCKRIGWVKAHSRKVKK